MSYFISNFVTAVRLQFQMMVYSQFFFIKLSEIKQIKKSDQINLFNSIKIFENRIKSIFFDFFQYENIERNDVQNISNRYIGRKKQPLKKTT